MEFKPLEIVAIVLALAIPIGAFALLFIPGGFNTAVNFVMDDATRPFLFYGAAGVVFLILGWRVYLRVRPKGRKPD